MRDGELRPAVLHEEPDREALAATLAMLVAGCLRDAVATRGQAVIAVSGGSTPKRFFEKLSEEEPGWERVTICLVDERFVPPDDERSNQRLVARHLLKNRAARARFLPLYRPVGDAAKAAALAAAEIDKLPHPFDAVILGMGNDGHTASFFPDGNHLAAAIDPVAEQSVLSMEAPDAGEPRLTLTLPHIVSARLLLLHIEGHEKRETLDRARQCGPAAEMPVRAVLDGAPKPLDIHWAP